MSPATSPKRYQSLGFRLALFILVSTTVVFLAAFAWYYQSSKALLLKNVRENARNLTRASVGEIETMLHGVEQVPNLLAQAYTTSKPGEEAILADLRSFSLASPEVYGAAVAFEPGRWQGDGPYAPYYHKLKGRLHFVQMGNTAYPLEDWFLIPRELRKPQWSEPYYDEGGGGVVMATYSAPFFTGESVHGDFMGVVTADVSLDWLQELVSRIPTFPSGFAFLVSRNGVFVSHPSQADIMRESLFSLAEAAGSRELRDIGRAMVQGREGFVPLPDFVLGKPAWLCFAPVASAGWSMGVVVPEDELFADLRRLSRQVVAIAGVGFCLLLVVISLSATAITRPLKALADKAAQIARGDLDTPVPLRAGADEVGRLSRSFEEMRLALKEYIASLTETTKAKERMESELKIARTIQMSFLPKRYPPFPDIRAFDLHAALEPALEVGGDLYDYFLLDDRRLLFLVGDVSGKGVPAALFMAVTKTLIKGIAEQEGDPAVILARVNHELCAENESNLFVTLFLAILDFTTGEVTFSNGGHNPPVFLQADGQARWLVLPKGLLLGILEDYTFTSASITLEPGDKILAYTDGVTEALNASGEFFTAERLLQLARDHARLGAEDLDRAVQEAVGAFAGTAPQADDITVLTLQYHGPAGGKREG